MMFNKAGRPKKNTAAETGLNKPWTNFFLEIGTEEYNGFMRLVEPLERFRNKR